MKEYDYVEVIVEKEKYAKQGVHKGMKGHHIFTIGETATLSMTKDEMTRLLFTLLFNRIRPFDYAQGDGATPLNSIE